MMHHTMKYTLSMHQGSMIYIQIMYRSMIHDTCMMHCLPMVDIIKIL